MMQKAFKVQAKLITSGLSKGAGDDRYKQLKSMREVEDREEERKIPKASQRGIEGYK